MLDIERTSKNDRLGRGLMEMICFGPFAEVICTQEKRFPRKRGEIVF